MSSLSNLKNVSERDRKMIQDAETMLGPEPSEIGFVKNLFWGRFREDLVFPYPEQDPDEKERCAKLLKEVEHYMQTEHPSIQIDREQEIPKWVIDRLFQLGVLGMIIPREYGGLGLGVTSYNSVLELIGRTCASTAVVVSAHQSIGCKAIVLFGTEEQKKRWLPQVATEHLSAFCLSEPNAGSDAAGQETRCELSEGGTHYILNGEKKWSTSAASSGLFTVMAKQRIMDPKTGREKDGITALVCTPDMPGIDIYEKNRSKCGIRGTWQARIRFTNVKVPRENLLHVEGRGLQVALTCLNFGRCTLSAGMLGAAKKSMDQAIKWSQTRYQFGRPLSDFDLMKQKIAYMSAMCYAMDAMLYMTTGMLDRRDDDIMLETAVNKVFCSEMGWRVVNDAMQIMGGEGFMTENEVERAFRDSRINTIVEGANEVMQSFIFAYGGKQLAEQMLSIQNAFSWNREQGAVKNVGRLFFSSIRPRVVGRAIPLGAQLFLGKKAKPPKLSKLHHQLWGSAERLARLVRDHSHSFKMVSKQWREEIIGKQTVQARIADNAMYLHAMTCVLSKLDRQLRRNESGPAFERDKAAAEHFLEIAELEFRRNLRALNENADESMQTAAAAALRHNDTLPNGQFYIPERSPVAAGTGKAPDKQDVKQFPGEGRKPAEHHRGVESPVSSSDGS